MLIDTQAIVWTVIGSPRLSDAARAAILDGGSELFVSAVTAFEYSDLNRRGRFGADIPLQAALDKLEANVLGFPAEA